MRSIHEFRTVRLIRLLWVWGLTVATIFLFVCLLITWSGVHWFVFPLNAFLTKIFENLFFAFTTGTIMMWFQNSVDGYSRMRDAYREIELNTSLLEIHEFSKDDFLPNDFWSDEKRMNFSYNAQDREVEIILDDGTIEEVFVDFACIEELDTIIKKDLSTPPYYGYFSEIIKYFNFNKMENKKELYISCLNSWIEILEHNGLFYDADDLSYDLDEYITEMKDFVKRIKSWRKGYVEDGKWFLERDDYSELYDFYGYNFDKSKVDFFYECHYCIVKTDEEKLEFDRLTKYVETEDGFSVVFPEQRSEHIRKDEWYNSMSDIRRMILMVNLEDENRKEFFVNYLNTEPKYHTKSAEYLAKFYLKLQLFELKAKEYNQVYWNDKQEMMKLYMR